MAGLPTPRSYEQILGDMLNTYMSKIAVNDLSNGSAVLSFFEAMSQAVYRSSGDTFAILRDFSVDRAEGEALKRIQKEERVVEIPARVATGKITITDSSMEKQATKIYAGSTPPNVGSIILKVSDASLFDAAGAIYIGRGTPNIEGPLFYDSITPIGGYYEINLSSGSETTKFHNLSESVILAKNGTRTIPVGSGVKTVASGSSPDITFTVTQKSIILDGEDTITSVPVSAAEPGTDGNIPKGSIRKFVSSPFTGAQVTNESPFTTGRNEETDDEIRNRIKKERISRGLGTAIAVKNAVLGVQSDEENAIVTSNEIFSDGEDTVLFIDNGSGYEESTKGTGLEFIVDSALGGETHFQLSTGGSQTSVAKAFLESTNTAPFAISELDRLAILVGGSLSEHEFKEGDFRSNGFASAYEVVSSINANADLKFSARTAGGGLQVTISAKTEIDEYVQTATPTTGGDSSVALGLPENEIKTLRLYINKQPLSKNGKNATIESANINSWKNAIATGDTLIISIDGTDSITYVFTDNDFIKEGTYPTVKNTNNMSSWVNVINSKIVGLTATSNGNFLRLSSNLTKSSRAEIDIDPSSDFVLNGIFPEASGLIYKGKETDYSFSRNTAQIKLSKSLKSGDSLTAGTEFTKGSVASSPLLGGSITLIGKTYLWFLVDSPSAEKINHAVVSDTLAYISKETNNVVKFRANIGNAFTNVSQGDYVILWSEEVNSGNKIEGRIQEIGTDILDNDFFKIRLTSDEYSLTTDQNSILFQSGLVFIRNSKAPQRISHESGTYDINVVANNLSNSLAGGTVSAKNNELLIVETETKKTNGSIFIVTFDNVGKAFNFTEGDLGESIDSQIAFHQSNIGEGDFPLFLNSTISAQDEFGDTPDSFVDEFTSALDLSLEDVSQNEIIRFLDPIVNSDGNFIEDSQSRDERIQMEKITGSTVSIDESDFVRSLRVGDRYFVASSFDFGHNDSIVVILDTDSSNKTFPVRLYRRAIANNTKIIDSLEFRAYDVDSGATSEFSDSFVDFSFKNYKALMQAKNVIDPSGLIANDAILFRSYEWGLESENFQVGYIYPSGPDNEIAHTTTVEEKTITKISLKSGPIVLNTIDGTTEWDISITPNTPAVGSEEVIYTYTGTGTAPTLTNVVAGNYITINNNGEFSEENTGTFKISNATTTSFTTIRATGSAVSETNIATLEVNTIAIYEHSETTASEMVDYVNSDIPDHLTAEIVDDGGTSGSGIIEFSTYEDSGYSYEFVDLLDGINYIESSTLTNTGSISQFIFKNALSLASFNTITAGAYAFNEGEEVRLIPTTSKQISEFMSVLAVTGLTTLGTVDTAQRENRLQIGTQVLGSAGAVEVSGGTANRSDATIIGTTTNIEDSKYCKTTTTRSSAAGFHAGQWIKVNSDSFQKKDSGIDSLTNISISTEAPEKIQSTITLGNKSVSDIFFGDLRNHISDVDRVFKIEKHGSLICIVHDGVSINPDFKKDVEIYEDNGEMSVDFNLSSGFTEYSVVNGTRKFIEVQVDDLIEVSGFSNEENNGTFKVYNSSDDGKTISVKNFVGVSETAIPIPSANISITTSIAEGDIVTISEPFSALNQGQFKILQVSGDSFYIDNESAVEETVLVPFNEISIGNDSTTEFDITVDEDMKVSWTGAGTVISPEIKRGDKVELGIAVSVNNQGIFIVNNVEYGLNEKFKLTIPSGSDILNSEYFIYDTFSTQYYVWFNKGSATDPSPLGRTGLEISIANSDSAQAVASKIQIAIDAVNGSTAALENATVNVVIDSLADVPDATNIDVSGDFFIEKIQDGELPYFELDNAKAVEELGVVFSLLDVFEAHRPAFKFSPYKNTVVGDKFVVSGDVLGEGNSGHHVISEVLSRNKILVEEVLEEQSGVTLDEKFTQVYIESGILYYGYKKIFSRSVDPSNSNRYILILESNLQSEKITQSSNTSISAMSKLGFSETLHSGLDSYRYDTGLIAESNKTVYGDPRDNVTYPGVSAAGAEIFIQPPLVRRIEVAISVRLNTGIPFSRITELVRNNIASLINSSPIGQSIAISDIISSVNKIQGVRAISISSPSYSVTQDVIVINPSEKPFILDIVNDISVSKIDS